MKILYVVVDVGVNFIDIVDVYEVGESEKVVGKFVKERLECIYVVIKCGC